MRNLRAHLCRKLQHKRGAALITVLVALMIISIVLLEFQYQSFVERKLAYNDLNQLQAYYLAKSGVHVGLLRIALYARARKDPNIKSAVGNSSQLLDMIWNLPLPAFPPDASSLDKLLKEDKDIAQKELKETSITDGKFTEVITSESSKINLNYLVVPPDQRDQRITFPVFPNPATTLFQSVGVTLINLMQNFLSQSDDPYNEYPGLNPEEVVDNIMDWVTPGQQSFAGGNKDGWYQQQNPPYLAKRNRFYSVDELRMVKGIDDHLFSKLKPYVTVYSYDGKINLNSATTEMIRALYRDFTDDDLKKISDEKTRIGGAWATEAQFVQFVTSNLGRTGFQTLYPNAQQYPFTVTSQSFMIESMGIITRSKSQIQKVIRVGVALSRGSGGQVLPATNPNDCTTQSGFWDTRVPPGQCKTPPTGQSDCERMAGAWNPTTLCCQFNGIAPVCPGQIGAGAAPPGGTGTSTTTPGTGTGTGTGTAPVTPDPNAVKILFWSET